MICSVKVLFSLVTVTGHVHSVFCRTWGDWRHMWQSGLSWQTTQLERQTCAVQQASCRYRSRRMVTRMRTVWNVLVCKGIYTYTDVHYTLYDTFPCVVTFIMLQARKLTRIKKLTDRLPKVRLFPVTFVYIQILIVRTRKSQFSTYCLTWIVPQTCFWS